MVGEQSCRDAAAERLGRGCTHREQDPPGHDGHQQHHQCVYVHQLIPFAQFSRVGVLRAVRAAGGLRRRSSSMAALLVQVADVATDSSVSDASAFSSGAVAVRRRGARLVKHTGG